MLAKFLSFSIAVVLSGCSFGFVLHPAEINPVDDNLDRAQGLLDSVDLSKIEINKKPLMKKSKMQKKEATKTKETQISEKMPNSTDKSALWLAALDALRIMPLLQVSQKEGVIVTEWLPNPQDAKEEIKIQVFVKEADNDIDVMLFKRKDGKQQLATATSAALKTKILTQAGIIKKEVKEVNSK